MAASSRYAPTIEELTEEVVFPLVRRRSQPPADDDDTRPSGSARRVVLVQTLGLVVFIAALAFLVLVWLVR